MNWQELTIACLEKLDVLQEFKSFGLEVTGEQRASGWCACRAIGRDDAKPSGAIYVGDGPLKGRYKDSAGETMGFFDFAAKYGKFTDWKSAKRHYLKQAGFGKKMPKLEEKVPRDRFDLNWVDKGQFQRIIKGLLESITPCSWEAVAMLSLRQGKKFGIAQYPKGGYMSQQCVCFPAYGLGMMDADPTGYVLMRADGKQLSIFNGKGQPPKSIKRYNAGTGIVGRYAIQYWNDIERVFRVEGISDLLVALTLMPADKRKHTGIITNASGATEQGVTMSFSPRLAGKDFFSLGDSDEAGELGSKLWANVADGNATTVHRMELPYEVVPSKGKDLKDWINS